MPGKKDFVSAWKNGMKEHVQKRLILSNLKELNSHFKEEYADLKIGFSNFALMRPKNCVLPGSSGTHCVCVCTIHQNIKLMINCTGMLILTEKDYLSIKTYQDCVARVICNPPLPSCYLGVSYESPGTMKIRVQLQEAFEMALVDNLIYSQWVSVDRTTLKIFQEEVPEFIDDFLFKVTSLKNHGFIAQQQQLFSREMKNSVSEGEYVVVCDFSENYALCKCKTKLPGKVTCKSFDCIYECVKHDTVAVHLFLNSLINFLTSSGKVIVRKMIHFSDGAPTHYKNLKNFIKICHHEEDFHISAEWHFFATAQGKGPCDGVHCMLRRLATRASLQHLREGHILTAKYLYEWAKSNIKAMSFSYFSNEDHL
ncbi:hypothetical protein J437_LFUL005064 [Ladona fulva]|uniref:Uncharacterized protein n=1 Tax=Ladona fulva TaxID=123851 RepID=A0A8K0KQK4_LADFU|nr:hypothetical protein J437_LFUL005064 [Ladona fulva]